MRLFLIYMSEATGGACRGVSRWDYSGALPSAGIDFWFLDFAISFFLCAQRLAQEVVSCDEHAA